MKKGFIYLNYTGAFLRDTNKQLMQNIKRVMRVKILPQTRNKILI